MEKNTKEKINNENNENKEKEYDRLSDSFDKWKIELRDKKREDKQPVRVSKAQASETIELNLRLPPQNEDDDISVKDIVTIFKKGSVKIFTVTLVSLVVAIVAAFIYYFVTAEYAGTVTGIISFNYKGAENGLDPYGRILDVTKIRSPQVINNVLTELNLDEKGVTVEDLRQNIVIQGIVPEDAMQRIMIIKEISTRDPSKLDQLADVSYISTQYAVTLSIPKKFSFLKNSNGTELLNEIFYSYQEYFLKEYSDKGILNTAVTVLPYSEYDYDDAAKVLNGQLDTIISYLASKMDISPNFRSNKTQMSFGDIITNLDLLKTIDLSKIRSIIEVRFVTKDSELLISTYRSLIVEKTLDRDVYREKALIFQQAAASYQKDSAVMFGAADSTLQFTQPSDTYDLLIKQATESSEFAVRLQGVIDYYEKRIADLQDPISILNRSADIALVEDAIASVSEKMSVWIDIVNETIDEYMETEALKDATKIVLLPQYTNNLMSSVKMMGVIVIAVVFIGFLLSTISVYVSSFNR